MVTSTEAELAENELKVFILYNRIWAAAAILNGRKDGDKPLF
jgi:hypothetical protein